MFYSQSLFSFFFSSNIYSTITSRISEEHHVPFGLNSLHLCKVQAPVIFLISFNFLAPCSIARFYGDSHMKVLNFGLKKEFLDRYDVTEVLKDNHLTKEQIVEDVARILA